MTTTSATTATTPVTPVAVDAELLLEHARAAALKARVPHSRFRVGAAVLCADGTIVHGCNIESDSFGLTCCAERTGLFAATAAGHRVFVALAVTCLDGDAAGDPRSVMPCGACRQVIAEFMPADAPVFVDGVDTFTPASLLPLSFTLNAVV